MLQPVCELLIFDMRVLAHTGPTTISCFGPVNSTAAAMALYSTCGTGFASYCTSLGEITYDLDCPIFNQEGVGPTYNMVRVQ